MDGDLPEPDLLALGKGEAVDDGCVAASERGVNCEAGIMVRAQVFFSATPRTKR